MPELTTTDLATLVAAATGAMFCAGGDNDTAEPIMASLPALDLPGAIARATAELVTAGRHGLTDGAGTVLVPVLTATELAERYGHRPADQMPEQCSSVSPPLHVTVTEDPETGERTPTTVHARCDECAGHDGLHRGRPPRAEGEDERATYTWSDHEAAPTTVRASSTVENGWTP